MTKGPTVTIEYRYVRADKPTAGDDGRLTGRGIVYNVWTTIGKAPWGFREIVRPGFATKSVKEGDMVLLDSHRSDHPIARQSAKTLDLKDTKAGLDWEAAPAKTTYAADVVENVRAGNYGGCSFGFEVVKDRWTRGTNGQMDERELLEGRVPELSVVTFPAYGATKVGVRDMVKAAQEAREAALGPCPDGAKKRKKAGKATRDAGYQTRIKNGTKKRVIQIDAELTQAMALFKQAGINSLPKQAQAGVALVSSAVTHSGHIKDFEKLKGSDASRKKPKPDPSTSEHDEDDYARRMRGRELAEGMSAATV